jgi:hypothetical protein
MGRRIGELGHDFGGIGGGNRMILAGLGAGIGWFWRDWGIGARFWREWKIPEDDEDDEVRRFQKTTIKTTTIPEDDEDDDDSRR